MGRLKKFRTFLDLGKYSYNTIDIYMRYAKEFERNIINNNIDQDYINQQISKHNHRVYRAFLKHYCRVNNIKADIPKIRGKEINRKLKYLPWVEIELLIERLPLRESLLVRLCSETGLRISEAVNLVVGNININKLVINGIGKMNKEFELPISKKTLDILIKYTTEKSPLEYVFDYGEVKHRRQKAWFYLKKYGYDVLFKNIHPHMLRHSCGTRLLKEGFNLREIQVFLRHSKIETTKIYTSVNEEQLYNKVRDLNK